MFLPASEIKAVRRAAVEALLARRRRHGRAAGLAEGSVLPQLLQELASRPVTAALALPWLEEVALDFLEVQGLREAVAEVRASGRKVAVATPRVLKPDEERLVHFFLRLRPDALLVRSAGLLHQLTRLGGPGACLHGLTDSSGAALAIPELHGDFSLNAANAVAAHLLLSRGQLALLAPTHDLSAPQICSLASKLGQDHCSASLEVVLHQHLPIFHTEHCVFARFLSQGNSFKDCGPDPCERHRLHLRDSNGADHLVLADMGCRNTLFNAQAQSGLFYLPELLRAGVRHFRVELVDEPSEVVAPLMQGYRDVLDGKQTPGEFWTWMRTLPDANGRAHGVGSGSLEGAAARDRSAGNMKRTAAMLREEQLSSR
ncbi:hypothetical protein QJQ45_026958 [Haematococcus lacustris]|nr:hypothetical protein QJQ45_026958 [Haematococcus lacustris]